MLNDSKYLLVWGLTIQSRTFLVAVIRDSGKMHWVEAEAVRMAGIEEALSFGAIDRTKHLMEEFRFESPGIPGAMELFRFAGIFDGQIEMSGRLVIHLSSLFDGEFWDYVNPQLENPLQEPSIDPEDEE